MIIVDQKKWDERRIQLEKLPNDGKISKMNAIAIMSFAERWANAMEKDLSTGKSFDDTALIAKVDANTEALDEWSIIQAAHVLIEVWQHGEQLQSWIQKEYQSKIAALKNAAKDSKAE